MAKNLSEWLLFLENLHPKAIDLGLERVRDVAQRLGLFPWTTPIITVTGTNGKGSSVMLLEAIYSAAGYKVGTYTSPHLFRYNERVRIAQVEVSDQDLCDCFELIEKVRAEISLTYFEFGTLAALLLFKKANLDVVILEVGLGGRLDAVNIIAADATLITSIDLDHMEFLGPDREAIGLEKAGIMRANKPSICGDLNPPHSLLNFAKENNVDLHCLDQNYFYEVDNTKNVWRWWNSKKSLNNLPVPTIFLANAANVLAVIDLMQTVLTVPQNAINQGLKNVFIPGRQQIVNFDGISVVFDVAHNPHAARLLAQRLKQENISGNNYAVFAMLKDKDIAATAECLKEIIAEWFVAGIDHTRGATASEIKVVLQNKAIMNVTEFADLKTAFDFAKTKSRVGDRIIVFGSFHTVNFLLPQSGRRCRQADEGGCEYKTDL